MLKPPFHPSNILLAAKQKKKTYVSLAKNLKKMQPRLLDEYVHELHEKVFEEINCLDCGNCCRTLGPRITSKDIEKMAKATGKKEAAFIQEYLRIDEDQDYVFKSMPCPFLQADNICQIYPSRPKACREYPHTDRKKFFQLIDLSLENTKTCPAVQKIFDQLGQV